MPHAAIQPAACCRSGEPVHRHISLTRRARHQACSCDSPSGAQLRGLGHGRVVCARLARSWPPASWCTASAPAWAVPASRG